MKPLLKFF